MRAFALPAPDRDLRVLALGCHSDDIEIGAGGTLLALRDSRERLDVRWVVLSANGDRREEAEAGARGLLGDESLTIECMRSATATSRMRAGASRMSSKA